MSSLKVTQITPRHLRGTTFIGENGSTTHFHPHSRVILHEYATKEWILEMLGDLDGADLSELVTKKYAHATFGEIFLGPLEPIGVKVTDLWFDTDDDHLKMCDRVDLDDSENVVGYHWINVAPRPSVDGDVAKLKEDVVVLQNGEIVDISTAPPADPKDGDLWYDNTEDTMQLHVYHQESDAWIAAAPPSTLDSRVAAGEALQAQIGEAVVDLQSDKLDKSGDDIHGSFYATEGRHLRFYGRDNNGRNKTFIDLVNTDGQGTEGTDHYLKLYHVATPSGPYHAANQKYVDDSISALGNIPDSTELLTETEIRNIVKSHGGTPILWKYNSTVPADQLGNGEFNLSSGLDSGSASEWSIYFANRDARGQRWFPHDSGQEYTHEIGDQMATIRERDAIVNHGKTTKWYFNQGTNNYVRLKLTYFRSQFAMANGKWYLINIPGYMPFFTYSSNSYSNGTHT